MKGKLVFFCLILIQLVSFGQYSMNTTMTTYQDISNPISLNNDSIWNEGSTFPIYFNFNFKIAGKTYTALNVMAGGGINFPGLGTTELFVYHSPFGGYLLKDKGTNSSLSQISYEITGISGQKLMKLQWKNAGLVQWYTTSDTSDFVNFQIWLFETDNHIEIHFGASSTDPGTYGYPESTSDANPGPSLMFYFNNCENVLGIIGPCNLPSYWIFNDCSWNPSFLDGTPSNGIIYNIYPSSASISEMINNSITVFPNPTNNILNISEIPEDFSLLELSIIDPIGQICFQSNAILENTRNLTFSILNLNDGVYFLKLTSQDNKTILRKIIKNSH
jgi:hypothetical protein